ncbi:hypothetical protein SAMN04515647_1838 [Cohaesibacter sp. ES.047]|uniref:hypothetical protein n=1 Tax=Cohaesibacter sp. ES.047 TaxID=1798205 RepID=UPI000BB6EE65|nr:hypothetical protein [Cohaesibacter sp. ES.047]SNY91609.1 hypothetical protein SAMN04515647_1838 [Cohaesibacter sp. ES.047]
MADLFISMGHDISVKNLGSGSFKCRELTSDECIKQFDELLLAFEAITGTRLTRNDFMSEPDEDGDQFPNLNYMTAVDETCHMQVVGYFFQFNPPSNMSSKAWKESFMVARDHMEFNLIKQVP